MLTKTGRATKPAPSLHHYHRKKWWAWLTAEAVIEATSRGDGHHARLFAGMAQRVAHAKTVKGWIEGVSLADVDMINDYLWREFPHHGWDKCA